MRRWMTAVLWLAAALPLSAQYNVKRLMEEGRRQLDMGYYVVAMQVFERIAAMKPHQYEAWYLSALCKYRLEDFKGAAEDGSRALALLPLPLELRVALLSGETGFGALAILLQNRALGPRGLMPLWAQLGFQLLHGLLSALVGYGLALLLL